MDGVRPPRPASHITTFASTIPKFLRTLSGLRLNRRHCGGERGTAVARATGGRESAFSSRIPCIPPSRHGALRLAAVGLPAGRNRWIGADAATGLGASIELPVEPRQTDNRKLPGGAMASLKQRRGLSELGLLAKLLFWDGLCLTPLASPNVLQKAESAFAGVAPRAAMVRPDLKRRGRAF